MFRRTFTQEENDAGGAGVEGEMLKSVLNIDLMTATDRSEGTGSWAPG